VFTLLVVLYILVCIFLILVVLVQQGKGADLAGAFGGGGTQTAFGPRSRTTPLHKMTTGAFIAFITIALLLAIIEQRPKSSVVKELETKGKPAAQATVPPAASPSTPPATTPAPAAPATK
jgi:preprotein translocase subunit SecG